MNIVFAQMKKDLVPLRGLLIGMGVLLALTLLGGVLDATGIVRTSGGNPLAALQFLFIAVMIVRLIHLDALTSPDAFWRTRPLSRAHLLLAKSALLIFPALAFTAMSQPWSTHAASGDFLRSCALLAGLAAFASVTRKLSEMALTVFLVYLPVIFLVMLVGLFGSLLLQLDVFQTWRTNPGNFREYLSTGANALTFAGFLAIVVFQYLTARTRVSIPAIGGILLFSSLISSLAEHAAR